MSITKGLTTIQRTVQLSTAAKEAEGVAGAGAVYFVDRLEPARQRDGIRLRDIDRWMQLIGSPKVGAIATFLVAAEQPLDPDSRVRLSSERDPHGVPRVDLDWRQGPAERRAISHVMRSIGAALGASGRARLQLTLGTLKPAHSASGSEVAGDYEIDPFSRDADEYVLEPGNHHMCTTRMSSSPRTGVVDGDCRVHGISNLYVAGSSVFSTGGLAPPTLTIVALALRLADHLAGVLRP